MPSSSEPLRAVAELPDISRLRIVRRWHVGRWLAAAVILLLLALIARAFAQGQIEWAYVYRFFT
ncbi:MAG: amino acid ABC transporter permease, partial [Hyphomicrobiales bacterium]|nr:amino acid ABC transporter permease [Hyphomicrobiales bacterium]